MKMLVIYYNYYDNLTCIYSREKIAEKTENINTLSDRLYTNQKKKEESYNCSVVHSGLQQLESNKPEVDRTIYMPHPVEKKYFHLAKLSTAHVILS
jgi:hypothetical protein